MPASEKRLGDLHARVAETLIEMVTPKEEADDAGNMRMADPSPAALAVAVAFLKHNSITADVDNDTHTKDLAERLARRGRVTDKDVKEAMDSVGRGLLN